MTDNQKNIVGAILLNMSANTVPITEDMISKLVDMNDNLNSMMYGTPKLTTEERDEVIAALHAALFVRIDRGHFVKEKDHTPWYMAAKAVNGSKFWDRYRLYLLKDSIGTAIPSTSLIRQLTRLWIYSEILSSLMVLQYAAVFASVMCSLVKPHHILA